MRKGGRGMKIVPFKTKTTSGDTAINIVMIRIINNIECVHVVTRLFVDENMPGEIVLRKFFGKYYIQREMIYKLSTFELINHAVLFLKNG